MVSPQGRLGYHYNLSGISNMQFWAKTELPQEEVVQNTLNTLHPQPPYRSAVRPSSHPIGAHQGHLRERGERAGTRSELKVASSWSVGKISLHVSK